MTKILPTYQINHQTLALIPARSIDYGTLVLEENQKLFIKQFPLEIIETNCIQHFSSYEGRRKAIMHQLGFKRKVPIPIAPTKSIYTFPTHAPDDHNCLWLFYHHIHQIKALTASHSNHSKIIFKNEIELDIDVTTYVLEKQMYRTGLCVGQGSRLLVSNGDNVL